MTDAELVGWAISNLTEHALQNGGSTLDALYALADKLRDIDRVMTEYTFKAIDKHVNGDPLAIKDDTLDAVVNLACALTTEAEPPPELVSAVEAQLDKTIGPAKSDKCGNSGCGCKDCGCKTTVGY